MNSCDVLRSAAVVMLVTPATGVTRPWRLMHANDAGITVLDRADDVVSVISREDVREMRGPVVARGSVAGTLLGGWLGFAAGVVPALGGAPAGAAWTALAGSVMGGASLGFRWSDHATDGLVYRAPDAVTRRQP